MRALLKLTAKTAARYLENLKERSVAPSPEALERLTELEEHMPELPMEADRILKTLDCIGSPATMAKAGPRYFGFVNRWLASGGPGGELAGWCMGSMPRPVRGITDRHCSARGFAALVTRRAETSGGLRPSIRLLANVGWDVEADALFGAPPITVVVGDEVHPSLIKALEMLGLGRSRKIRVPVDDQGRMVASAMPFIGGPAIVCMQAGNVNTGAFDPAEEICARAHSSGAWVHIDGAFGLWAAASPRYEHLIEGTAGADSWATDEHKWLNVPYDGGLAFVKDAAALKNAMP